jgi:hypothetical protein
MNFFEAVNATIKIYFDSARFASTALVRNWPLLLGVVGAFGIYAIVASIFGRMGFAGGMVVGMTQIVLLSVGYSWLSSSVSHERIKIKELYTFDYGLFSTVINTGFIIFIAKFLLSIFAQSSGSEWIMVLVQFALVVICNALPEVLYIMRAEGLNAISESVDFMKRNWIEWFIPLLLFLVPWIVVSLEILLILISKMDELLPATIVFNVVRTFSKPWFESIGIIGFILSNLIAVVMFVWFMLFRGFLFKELISGSRRQRIFKAKL